MVSVDSGQVLIISLGLLSANEQAELKRDPDGLYELRPFVGPFDIRVDQGERDPPPNSREVIPGSAFANPGDLVLFIDPCYFPSWGRFDDLTSLYRQACEVTRQPSGHGSFHGGYGSGAHDGDGAYPIIDTADRHGTHVLCLKLMGMYSW